MTTTEDNSGQSAPERGAASQPASQPRTPVSTASNTQPSLTSHTPRLSSSCFRGSLRLLHPRSGHNKTHHGSLLAAAVIASPLRARENDRRRAHRPTPKKKTPDFDLLTVHIKKKETAGACSHTPNPSRYSFPTEIQRQRGGQKTKKKKLKTNKCLVLCVCVCVCVLQQFLVFWWVRFRVLVFILPVAETQGGEGEGERRESGGWSSSFFAREDLWSRGSVSDSSGMCVSLSCSAAAFWVFLELNLWNSGIVFVFVVGCVVEEWIHSRFFWELAAYVYRALFGIWDRDWLREREREREIQGCACTFLLFFFFSGRTRGNLDCTVLQFCVPIKKQTLLTKELVVLGLVQTNF